MNPVSDFIDRPAGDPSRIYGGGANGRVIVREKTVEITEVRPMPVHRQESQFRHRHDGVAFDACRLTEQTLGGLRLKRRDQIQGSRFLPGGGQAGRGGEQCSDLLLIGKTRRARDVRDMSLRIRLNLQLPRHPMPTDPIGPTNERCENHKGNRQGDDDRFCPRRLASEEGRAGGGTVRSRVAHSVWQSRTSARPVRWGEARPVRGSRSQWRTSHRSPIRGFR